MNEAGKAAVIIFPPGQYPVEFVQPCKQTLNLPSPLVATQRAAIPWEAGMKKRITEEQIIGVFR